jgi:hypothetical protein
VEDGRISRLEEVASRAVAPVEAPPARPASGRRRAKVQFANQLAVVSFSASLLAADVGRQCRSLRPLVLGHMPPPPPF